MDRSAVGRKEGKGARGEVELVFELVDEYCMRDGVVGFRGRRTQLVRVSSLLYVCICR